MATHEKRQRQAREQRAAAKGAPTYIYEDRIEVEADEAEDLIERIREVGSADRGGVVIRFTVETEAGQDLWDLREVLDDLHVMLQSQQVDWTPERDRVRTEYRARGGK